MSAVSAVRCRHLIGSALAVLVLGLAVLMWAPAPGFAQGAAPRSPARSAVVVAAAPQAAGPSQLATSPDPDHARHVLTLTMLATAGGALLLLALGHRRA